MKLIPENIKSVTVVKLDHIGDVILATPVIESLRIGYPEAKIRVVVGSWSKGVLVIGDEERVSVLSPVSV